MRKKIKFVAHLFYGTWYIEFVPRDIWGWHWADQNPISKLRRIMLAINGSFDYPVEEIPVPTPPKVRHT